MKKFDLGSILQLVARVGQIAGTVVAVTAVVQEVFEKISDAVQPQADGQKG